MDIKPVFQEYLDSAMAGEVIVWLGWVWIASSLHYLCHGKIPVLDKLRLSDSDINLILSRLI